MPSSTSELRKTERKLRKQRLQVLNRLRSIKEDADFVDQVSSSYFPSLPIVPNLRNGLWYAKPSNSQVSKVTAYFKSTDGHQGNVAFHLSRTNIHLLNIATQGYSNAAQDDILPCNAKGGILLLDSTRYGKQHPDSFTRTVPGWCAIINTAISFVKHERRIYDVLLPPWVKKERENIDWEDFVQSSAKKILYGGSAILDYAKKEFFPLKPIWVNPLASEVSNGSIDPGLLSRNVIFLHGRNSCDPKTGTNAFSAPNRCCEDEAFTPIVCLSTSVAELSDLANRQFRSWSYIQGAGDDEESWAQGLKPADFWAHENLFLHNTNEQSCEIALQKIVRTASTTRTMRRIKLQPCLIASDTSTDDDKFPKIEIKGMTSGKPKLTLCMRNHLLIECNEKGDDEFWIHQGFNSIIGFFFHSIQHDNRTCVLEGNSDILLCTVLSFLLMMFYKRSLQLTHMPCHSCQPWPCTRILAHECYPHFSTRKAQHASKDLIREWLGIVLSNFSFDFACLPRSRTKLLIKYFTLRQVERREKEKSQSKSN